MLFASSLSDYCFYKMSFKIKFSVTSLSWLITFYYFSNKERKQIYRLET